MPDVNPDANDGWKVDVQKWLAWIIILLFVAEVAGTAWKIITTGQPDDILDIHKDLKNTLTNIVLLVVGYFFGSSQSTRTMGERQQRVLEKAIDAAVTGPAGPAGPTGPKGPSGGSGAPGGEALAAAAAVAPLAAAIAAPPAAEAAAPAAAERAIDDAIERGDLQPKPKE